MRVTRSSSTSRTCTSSGDELAMVGRRHSPTSRAPPTCVSRVSRNHPTATEPRADVRLAFARFAARADRTRVGARSVAPAARLAMQRRETVVTQSENFRSSFIGGDPADAHEEKKRNSKIHVDIRTLEPVDEMGKISNAELASPVPL